MPHPGVGVAIAGRWFQTTSVAMSSDAITLRGGRELSVIRRSGRYGDSEVDALGMADDEPAVKLAHAVVEAGRPAGAEPHDLIEIADPVGTI